MSAAPNQDEQQRRTVEALTARVANLLSELGGEASVRVLAEEKLRRVGRYAMWLDGADPGERVKATTVAAVLRNILDGHTDPRWA